LHCAAATLNALEELGFFNMRFHRIALSKDSTTVYLFLDPMSLLRNEGNGVSISSLKSQNVLEQIAAKLGVILEKNPFLTCVGDYGVTYRFSLTENQSVNFLHKIPEILNFSELGMPDKHMLIPIPLGHDGERIVWYDISFGTHILVHGQTGRGKSSLVRSWLASIITYSNADKIKFVLCDPQKVSLGIFRNLSNEWLHFPLAAGSQKTVDTLVNLEKEMHVRENLLYNSQVNDIEDYNRKTGSDLPYIIIVVDELYRVKMELGDEQQKISERVFGSLLQSGRKVGFRIVGMLPYIKASYLPTEATAQAACQAIFSNTSQAYRNAGISSKEIDQDQLQKPGRYYWKNFDGLKLFQAPFVRTPDIISLMTAPSSSELCQTFEQIIDLAHDNGSIPIQWLMQNFNPGDHQVSQRQIRSALDIMQNMGILSPYNKSRKQARRLLVSPEEAKRMVSRSGYFFIKDDGWLLLRHKSEI